MDEDISKKVTAVILAAGQGRRMNTAVSKQFLMLEDKPVLYYSIKAFDESLADDMVIVCSKDQVDYCVQNIIEPYGFKKPIRVVKGGRERYDSVMNALKSIDDTGYVLIHDAARPFITPELINNVIDAVKVNNACITAVPVKDTIKNVDGKGRITGTPDREHMWLAQTPQAFEYSLIRRAYELLFKQNEADRKMITDDAMVYERFINKPVKIVEGDYYNIKLTTPEDLVLAKSISSHIKRKRFKSTGNSNRWFG